MRDVAERAGTSVMTVSLALRNDPSVSQKTADRVREVAREIGYQPNPLVSALMANLRPSRNRKQTLSLGFISAFESRNHWKDISVYRNYFEGAARRAEQQGFRLEPFWLGEPGMTAERFNGILRTRSIQGIMVCPIPEAGGTLPLAWEQFACVALGYSLANPPLHRACNHGFHTMMLALSRLCNLGYRRIGLAMLRSDDKRIDHNWIASYLYHYYQVLMEPHLPIGLFDEWNEAELAAWFREVKPDAVISTRYFVRHWLENLGSRVPNDIGFALLDVSEASEPCAGIDQRSEGVGAAAMDLLTGQMYRNERGIPAQAKITLIDGEWVAGPTVRQPS